MVVEGRTNFWKGILKGDDGSGFGYERWVRTGAMIGKLEGRPKLKSKSISLFAWTKWTSVKVLICSCEPPQSSWCFWLSLGDSRGHSFKGSFATGNGLTVWDWRENNWVVGNANAAPSPVPWWEIPRSYCWMRCELEKKHCIAVPAVVFLTPEVKACEMNRKNKYNKWIKGADHPVLVPLSITITIHHLRYAARPLRIWIPLPRHWSKQPWSVPARESPASPWRIVSQRFEMRIGSSYWWRARWAKRWR